MVTHLIQYHTYNTRQIGEEMNMSVSMVRFYLKEFSKYVESHKNSKGRIYISFYEKEYLKDLMERRRKSYLPLFEFTHHLNYEEEMIRKKELIKKLQEGEIISSNIDNHTIIQKEELKDINNLLRNIQALLVDLLKQVVSIQKTYFTEYDKTHVRK